MLESKMYHSHAKDYDRAIQDNIFNAHLERPSLQSLLGPLQGKDVLDLGCGSGVYAQFFLERGVTGLTCVDGSDQMVDLVRSKFGQRLISYVQDLTLGLPQEKDETFDLVVSPLVIHYIKDLVPLFKEIYRVLRVGGEFVFSTHHPLVDFDSSPSGNYFKTELVNETWDTIGSPLEVSFYRRPLSQLINPLLDSGLVLKEVFEGAVDPQVKDLSASLYERLTKHPNFIFIKCLKY